MCSQGAALELVRLWELRVLVARDRQRLGAEERVLQCLASGQAPSRIQAQEPIQQVASVLGQVGERRVELSGAGLARPHVLVPGCAFEPGPGVARWRPAEAEDAVERLQVGRALERVRAGDQLGHDAPDRPHVHTAVVLLDAHEEFRWAVPHCHHTVRVVRASHVGEARQAEIRNTNAPVVVDEDVRRCAPVAVRAAVTNERSGFNLTLHVPMHDMVGVQVVETLEDLLQVVLGDGGGYLHDVVLDEAGQVVIMVRKDHVNGRPCAIQVCIDGRIARLQPDNVRVPDRLQDLHLA